MSKVAFESPTRSTTSRSRPWALARLLVKPELAGGSRMLAPDDRGSFRRLAGRALQQSCPLIGKRRTDLVEVPRVRDEHLVDDLPHHRRALIDDAPEFFPPPGILDQPSDRLRNAGNRAQRWNR